MSKKVLSLVLALVMVLGTFGTAFAAAATTPTGNEKVDKLIELGLVKGYADGTYGLAQAITRAEMATMVVRALDLEAVANASAAFPSQFTDMNSANVLWARGFVNVAAGQGIVNGYPNGTFVPANNVTYAEAAAMLVRVLGGLTEAETKTAVWPTTYLAKAAQLGVFADVDGIVDYNAPATRENLFEMVFNTLTVGTDLLIASTVEGIVVENYRTEALNMDEVVVHVMKDQVQRSDESKYFEAGDEYKLVLTDDLKEQGFDAESLLGKVITVSFDKAGKVVGIKLNKDYSYLQGELSDVVAKSLKLDGKSYTVSKDEGRKADDERLFQVYFNNADFTYEGGRNDFVGEVNEDEALEFAKITVRNGKVLFIDAFGNFEDIAPVAKAIDTKDRVTYFDDVQEGQTATLTVDEDAYVINIIDGDVQLGNHKDIDVNDVIHWLETEDEELVVFVRPADDAKVEGEFVEARTPRRSELADVYVKVKDTYYPGYIETANRNLVYSFYASDIDEYDVLGDDFLGELEAFEEEEVVVLLDMFGNVQLIANETAVLASEYALISDVYGTEFRLLLSDNTKDWFTTNRDTKLSGADAREIRLAEYKVNNLVKAYADEDNILSELKLYKKPATANFPGAKDSVISNVSYVANKAVEFNDNANTFKFVNNKTVVFVVGITDVVKEATMSVADFVKKYDQAANLTGYAVTSVRDAELVEAIVIESGATLKASEKGDLVFGKVDYVGRNFIYIAGSNVKYSVTDTMLATLKKGDIVEITLEKDSETKVKAIRNPFDLTEKEQETLSVEYITVKSTSRGRIQATNNEEYAVEDARVFDSYKVGDELTIVVDKYNVIKLLKKGSAPADTTAPQFVSVTRTAATLTVKSNENVTVYIGDTATFSEGFWNFEAAADVATTSPAEFDLTAFPTVYVWIEDAAGNLTGPQTVTAE